MFRLNTVYFITGRAFVDVECKWPPSVFTVNGVGVTNLHSTADVVTFRNKTREQSICFVPSLNIVYRFEGKKSIFLRIPCLFISLCPWKVVSYYSKCETGRCYQYA